MSTRIQTINNDTTLRITENKPVTITLSEKALVRRRAYLESGIAKFQGELSSVNEQLSMIYEEKERAG
jgi:hypothetical protein